MDSGQDQNQTQARTCTSCGMSLEYFKRTSKLGCAQCYAAFADDIRPIARRLHGTSRHNGKVPGRIGQEVQHKKLLEQYEGQLKIALMKEDYESAALYRDKIKDLKGSDLL